MLTSKASMQSLSQFHKVLTRLGLVFFENESLGSASKSLASFTSLSYTLGYMYYSMSV